MRIGLVNEYFPPFAPGGAEWSMLALAQRLAQTHHVIVITPNYGTNEFEELEGIRVYRFKSRARLEAGQTTVRFRWLANPLFYRHSAKEIERIAQSEKLDILHAQNKYSLPGTWLASRKLSIPVVYTIRDVSMICPLGWCLMKYRPVHSECGHWGHWRRDCRLGYLQNYFPSKRKSLRLKTTLTWLWLDTQLRRWFFRRADGITSVSEGILQIYHQAGLLTEQPTRTIYNIPSASPSVPEQTLINLRRKFGLTNQKIVFYAGRFTPGKGVQDLVEAADIVINTVPNVLFLFAGEGNLTLSGPHTRSLGRLTHKEVEQMYHLANIVAIPSRQPEPLTRVALEAMAAGCPLIGTNVGGTPELIIHGLNGFLVEPASPTELAKAITNLLTDESLQVKMGQASQKLLQTRFAAEQSLEKLLDLYCQVIAIKQGQER